MKKEKIYSAMLAAAVVLSGSQVLYANEQTDAPAAGKTETETADAVSSAVSVTAGNTDIIPASADGEGQSGLPETDRTGAGNSETEPGPAVQEIAQFGYHAVIQNDDGSYTEETEPWFLGPGRVTLEKMIWQDGKWLLEASVSGADIAEPLGYECLNTLPGSYQFDPEAGEWTPVSLPVLTMKKKTPAAADPEPETPDSEPETEPAPVTAPTLEELGLYHYAEVSGPGIGLGTIKPGTVTISEPQINAEGETFVTAVIDASKYASGSRLPTEESITSITYIWNGHEWELQGSGFRLVYNYNEPGTLKPSAPDGMPSLEQWYLNRVAVIDPVSNSVNYLDVIPGTVTLSEMKSTSDGIAYVTAVLDSNAYKNEEGLLPVPAVSTTEIQIIWNGYSWQGLGEFTLRYPFTAASVPEQKPSPEDLRLHLTIRQGDNLDNGTVLPGSVTVSDLKSGPDGLSFVTAVLDSSRYERDGVLPSQTLSKTVLNFYWSGDAWLSADGAFILVYPLEGAGFPDSGEENRPGTGDGNQSGAEDGSIPETGAGSVSGAGEKPGSTGTGSTDHSIGDRNNTGQTDKTGHSSAVPTGVLSLTGLWGAAAAVSAGLAVWLKKKRF